MSWSKSLAAVTALVLGASAGLTPATAEQITIRLDWQVTGNHAPFYLAQQKGWFKKYGLDVKIDTGTGSVSTSQLVGTGQYDLGFAVLSVMAFAKDKGMPLISVAGLMRKSDLALMVPADSPIQRPADIKGKKLAYAAASVEAPFLDPFLASGGLTRGDVNLVSLDPPSKIPAYATGTADGVFSTTTFTLPIVAAKRPAKSLLFADYGLPLPGFGLITTDAKLKQKGEAIKKFVSIVAGAWTYIAAGHEDEGVQAMIAANPQDKLDETILRGQWVEGNRFVKTAATEGLPIGVQAESDWVAAVKVLEDAKTIAPGSKPSSYFTNDYLDLNLVKAVSAGS